MRRLVRRITAYYFSSPECNTHVNVIAAGMLTALAVGTSASIVAGMGGDRGMLLLAGLITKECVQTLLESVFHYVANARIYPRGNRWRRLVRGLAHHHASTIIPGIVYTVLAVGLHALFLHGGLGGGWSGFLAYTLALIPSRLLHHLIAQRSGFFSWMRSHGD